MARVVNGDPYRPVLLTQRGEQEARQLGDQLRNVELDVAFCTRFPRTRETAEIALGRRRVPLLVEPNFDDVDVGALDGATIDDFSQWKHRHRRGERFPDGESLDEAAERYSTGLRALLDRPEQRLLVVCHAVVIRSILEVLDDTVWRHVPNAVPYLFDENAIRTAAHRLVLYGQIPKAS